MVALLEKIDGSEGFHQIVDFLNASHIRFALSKNPTIYDSHIKQFWQTATVNTLDNREQEITTTVDGHVKTVTIASVRKYLQLADAGGLSSLPNTEIFDQLSLMGEETPLFATMFVIDQTSQGEGSAIPAGSQHTSLMAPSTKPHPDTSAQSPITEPRTSPPQITEPPASSTIRETIRQEVMIPQSNFPTQTPVADEAAFIGVYVVHGGAATTVSSIDVGQGSGNITKSPTMPHDSPLLGGHTPRSDKGSMTLHELTVLCTQLSNKVESLETELKQTKQTYGAAFTKLIKKVKKLEQTVKTSQTRRRTKIIASDDEEDLVVEDPSKHGRSMIEEIDLDVGVSLVPPHVEVLGSTFISTASPQRHANTTADDLTLAKILMEIRKSAAKAKGKAKMDENESLKKMKQREQLQAGEKCSEEDLPMKLVELVNQRKKFFAQQRAEAKRNKPMNPTQQKEHMSNYIKNQEGGYSIKQLKSLSFEQVKEIFETTLRKVQTFVPMGSELEVQRLKRVGQEVLEDPVKRQKVSEALGLGEESAEKEKALSEEEL
ncbi:hypothetical protein Tco_1386784 [Tanacetum coccineum]